AQHAGDLRAGLRGVAADAGTIAHPEPVGSIMRIPILMNGREVVRSWQGDNQVDPEVRETGYGAPLDREVVAQLVEELSQLTRSLPATREGRRQFDQRAAQLLGQRLNLPRAAAADKRFWQWFTITRAEAIVLWRWNARTREAVGEQN